MSDVDINQTDINTVSKADKDAFEDPQGVFPRREYFNIASTNLAARGLKRNNLYIGGGHVALDLGLQPYARSQYPLNQVRETISGHVTEVDDTPGGERMLFKHRTGAGVEMRPDGTVIISSTNNTIMISGGDQKVIVEGNGEVIYNGNLKLNVSGDFDLKVGGNFNITTGGDKKEQINGGYEQNVVKNHNTYVTQNKAEYVVGVSNETILDDKYTIVGANSVWYNEGDMNVHVGTKDPDDGSGTLTGRLTMTATNSVYLTSDNMNLNARDMTCAGDVGTIGGENIIMYNYNMYTGHSVDVGDTVTVPTIYNDTQVTSGHMNIPVVYGDLQGTATKAIDADTAHSQSYGDFHGDVGSSPGYTAATDTTADIPIDTRATKEMTETLANYLQHNSSIGSMNVNVDPGDVMKNNIDMNYKYGNISARKLNTAEIRSKLRDPNTLRNTSFIGSQINEGKLSETYTKQIPPKVGRVVNNTSTPNTGSRIMPNAPGGKTKRFKTQ